MSYVINKFSGAQLVVLEDGTIDTTTSIGLVGRNYVGYGEIQNENFIYLLENFANTSPPPRPLVGQIWFNTINNVAYTYNGSNWGPIGAAIVSVDAPREPTVGALWLKTTDNTLYVWLGSSWRFIGPEAVPGFASTRARATALLDSSGNSRPVIILETNGIPIAVCTSESFVINSNSTIPNLDNNLVAGINLTSLSSINGNISGNAGSANKLASARTINGTSFDGTQNITLKSSTSKSLLRGQYLIGANFDGGLETTWEVDATPSNIIGKVVARNSEGGFSAGPISATFIGNLTGNVTSATGTSRFNVVEANRFIGATLSGNADSANQLSTPRRINGVSFNGTSDITISADANTLTGSTLSSSVTQSNLQGLGTLSSLNVADAGVTIGNSGQFRLLVNSNIPTIRSPNGRLKFDMLGIGPEISFIDPSTSLLLGGPNQPAVIGDNLTNLGILGYKFNNIYANYFKGTDVEIDTLSSATSGNITANGNLIVTGNLTVQGNVTAVNSTELTIEDKLITLASGAATAAEANGAGIFINGSGASLMYSNTGNKWVLNKLLDMGSNDVVTTGLLRGTATSAQYADLAENYLADNQYEPGTVLEIGGMFEVTIAQELSNKIAGVVSTNPAYLMNSECKGKYVVAVALQGRIPCKIKGPVQKGNMLVSAGNGFAKATEFPQFGTIIGKSLEDFDGLEGTIEVLVGRI
jgi:hypothetical protein